MNYPQTMEDVANELKRIRDSVKTTVDEWRPQSEQVQARLIDIEQKLARSNGDHGIPFAGAVGSGFPQHSVGKEHGRRVSVPPCALARHRRRAPRVVGERAGGQ